MKVNSQDITISDNLDGTSKVSCPEHLAPGVHGALRSAGLTPSQPQVGIAGTARQPTIIEVDVPGDVATVAAPVIKQAKSVDPSAEVERIGGLTPQVRIDLPKFPAF